MLLTEVNVSDPAAMKVARTLTVDGSYVSARLNGGTARVVLNTPPRLPEPSAPAALRSFVPETVIKSNISGRTFKRSLVPCRDVRRPIAFSGLSLLSLLTIDLDRGLYSVDRDAVLAGAQVVYASTRSLYVASQRFVRELDTPDDIPSRMTTEIHRFDISDPGRTTYASSGTVPGFVLNQYALSEERGVLRVASTEEPLWMGGDVPARDSESTVSVLREQGARLVTVGSVGGLGKTERIYAVRFIGDAGYLVTFRQVDPLFTLDLADPEHPKVAGELTMAGYSAYLHPIGDGLLLGVGQDATEAGRRKGAQVSVFDVSDLAKPSRLYARALGSASRRRARSSTRTPSCGGRRPTRRCCRCRTGRARRRSACGSASRAGSTRSAASPTRAEPSSSARSSSATASTRCRTPGWRRTCCRASRRSGSWRSRARARRLSAPLGYPHA